jgi:twitching motility protein PilT
MTTDAISPEQIRSLSADLLDEKRQRLLEEEGQVDFSHQFAELARLRINAYRQQGGPDLVLRIIPPEVRSLDELGLPRELARFTTYHQGLVLITGPSGCGKTSTLASLVKIINHERSDHIITAEDPIEYIHPSESCVVNQRQVGTHSQDFPTILRAALREDPDVIVLGELRDLETVSLALTAAETGHLVLGTLHTGGAIRTINRLIGIFPPDEQPQVRVMLSESLRAVISQRLVPRADGQGRVPALELMVVTRAIGNLIREKKVFQIESQLQTGKEKGMRTLKDSFEELVRQGTVTAEEAQRHL